MERNHEDFEKIEKEMKKYDRWNEDDGSETLGLELVAQSEARDKILLGSIFDVFEDYIEGSAGGFYESFLKVYNAIFKTKKEIVASGGNPKRYTLDRAKLPRERWEEGSSRYSIIILGDNPVRGKAR